MAGSGKSQSAVIAPNQAPQAGSDPIKVMLEIAQSDLEDTDKTQLIEFAKNRFRHRRRMAYIALWSLVISLLALLVMGFTCPASFEKVANSGLLISLEAFLTAIVGAYYGVSAWRPAS